jgi:hypothetical protein
MSKLIVCIHFQSVYDGKFISSKPNLTRLLSQATIYDCLYKLSSETKPQHSIFFCESNELYDARLITDRYLKIASANCYLETVKTSQRLIKCLIFETSTNWYLKYQD